MKKILLIEDNEEIRENTSEILYLAGYKVLVAANGKEGVALALKDKPDLIVCDIMMPVLDGFGVLHMIHRNEGLQDIPFIFLTAMTERSDFRKGMEMGADDYLTKPFNGTDLLHAIESRLKKAELRKQSFSPDPQGLHKLMQEVTGGESLASLVEEGNIDRYKKKQVVYSAGNHPLRLYYIRKGKVKTYKQNDEGKELVMDILGEGDFMGYTALLEDTVYKETAVAIEDCQIAVIPREDFETLLHSNRDVAIQFVRLLARNVVTKEKQLLGLAYNSLRKKVAEALVTLHHKYNQHRQTALNIDISRENLAAIAGTATESLIRTLGDFRDERLIDIKDGVIVILNEKKLSSLLY